MLNQKCNMLLLIVFYGIKWWDDLLAYSASTRINTGGGLQPPSQWRWPLAAPFADTLPGGVESGQARGKRHHDSLRNISSHRGLSNPTVRYDFTSLSEPICKTPPKPSPGFPLVETPAQKAPWISLNRLYFPDKFSQAIDKDGEPRKGVEQPNRK